MKKIALLLMLVTISASAFGLPHKLITVIDFQSALEEDYLLSYWKNKTEAPSPMIYGMWIALSATLGGLLESVAFKQNNMVALMWVKTNEKL